MISADFHHAVATTGLEGLLGLVLALFTTLATIAAYSVGFLFRPSRTTLLWSTALTVAMIAGCGVVAADAVGSPSMRLAALGLFAGVPALVWSGMRARRTALAFVWTGPLVSAGASVAMLFSDDPLALGPVWRIALLAAGVFAALVVAEWVVQPRPRDPFLVPLVAASALLVAIGVLVYVTGLVGTPLMGLELITMRLVRTSFLVLFLGCVLIATIGPSIRDIARRLRTGPTREWDRFEESAHARLVRGRETGTPWSVISFQLDDAAEVRRVAGAPALATTTSRAEQVLRETFPPDAEISSPAAGVVVVLTPSPNPQVRQLIRVALSRISQLPPYGRIPVRPSASAGWVPASTAGYDLTVLLYLAAQAAANAQARGGDRWERVSPETVLGAISPSERP
jgi:hypothetical protein